MLVIPKAQPPEEVIRKGIIHSYLRAPDMVVKGVLTMETPTKETETMIGHQGEIMVMEEHQMIMIQMTMMITITVVMMTPLTVIDTHGQEATILNPPT